VSYTQLLNSNVPVGLYVEFNDISRMHETAKCGVRSQKRKQKQQKLIKMS